MMGKITVTYQESDRPRPPSSLSLMSHKGIALPRRQVIQGGVRNLTSENTKKDVEKYILNRRNPAIYNQVRFVVHRE